MKELLHIALIIFLVSACKTQTEKAAVEDDESSVDSVKEGGMEKEEYFSLDNFQSLVNTYEDPDRSQWQNPELILQKMGDLENVVVADIGAGTGYFTFRMASQGARVIAIDVDQRFLEYIEERHAELDNIISGDRITTRLAKENDPLLANGEIDIALIVNTYHFMQQRVDYLNKLRPGLKPGGKIIIVDYKIGDMPVGPPENIKVPLSNVKRELEAAGIC